MSDDVVFIGRKGWIAYAGVVVAVLLLMFITLIASDYSATMPLWVPPALLVIAFLGYLKWRSLRHVRWVVTQTELRRHWGFLPWTRGSFGHAGDQIYETHYGQGIFETVFRAGMISIDTTAGTTETIRESFMADRKRLCQEIYELQARAKNSAAAANPASGNPVSELKDLAELRSKGDLSDEEFEAMKRNILARS